MRRGQGVRRTDAAGPGPRRRGPGRNRGQATAEVALVIPFVVLALLALVQVGLVVRARVMVTHAAREGARVAAVGGTDAEVEKAVEAAADLPVERVGVTVRRSGGTATVEVRYHDPTDVALVGGLVDDVTLGAVARMRLEDP